MRNKKLFDWWLSGGSPIPFDLLRANINYRTTDYGSYLLSAAFSDTGTIAAAAKVISVATIAPNTNSGGTNNNAVAGIAYIWDEVNGDRIVIHETDTAIASFFPANNMVQAARLFTVSGSVQGLSFDSVNQRLHLPSGGTMIVKNLAGTTVATYTMPDSNSDSMAYYDHASGEWWVAPEIVGPLLPVQRRTLSGTTISIAETKWYAGADGVCRDQVFNRIVNFDGSGATWRIREQTIDGKDKIFIWPAPIGTLTSEGLIVFPDGTFGFCEPSGLAVHGGVVGGNRFWRTDQRGVYLKHERYPSMTRFAKCTGDGTVSGNFDQQKITANTGETIWFPVVDSQGFSNLDNASAYTFEMSEGGDGDKVFRGSDTAPTVSPFTSADSNLVQYESWGDTVPGASQSTPPALRYRQFGITVKEATPSTTITVQDLIDGLPSMQGLFEFHDDEKMYVLFDSTSPANQVRLVVNQADTNNNLANATASQRMSYNASGYTDDQNSNQNEILGSVTALAAQTQGQLTFVCRRSATNSQAVLMELGTSGSSNNRFDFKWHGTSNTPASELCIEESDGSGTVIHRVGIAKTDLVHKQTDFRCGASLKEIRYERVIQTLNVSVGTNNNRWFSSLGVTPNICRIGLGNGFVATGQFKFLMILSAPATAALPPATIAKFPTLAIEQDLIDAYIDQKAIRE